LAVIRQSPRLSWVTASDFANSISDDWNVPSRFVGHVAAKTQRIFDRESPTKPARTVETLGFWFRTRLSVLSALSHNAQKFFGPIVQIAQARSSIDWMNKKGGGDEPTVYQFA
jgi:hypothetical protein